MRELAARYSDPHVGRLFRCSAQTVFRARHGKLKAKDGGVQKGTAVPAGDRAE